MAVDCYICPTCGSEVRVGSRCPGCAPGRKRRRRRVSAGRRKAWEQDTIYDGAGIPDDGFDYEEFVRREFGGSPHRRIGIKWYWWVTGAVLVGAMVWALAGGLFG